MNSEQKRALAILDSITPELVQSRKRNGYKLLASSAVQPPFTRRPEAWEEGWCKGWAFAVQPELATALGIALTPKLYFVLDAEGEKIPLRNAEGEVQHTPAGKIIFQQNKMLEWTQSSIFDFRTGYTIHSRAEALTGTWSEALKAGVKSLRIESASPSVPASTKVSTFDTAEERDAAAASLPEGREYEKEDKTEKGQPRFLLREFIPRNRGQVSYVLYEAKADGTGTEVKGKYQSTQDGFIRLLITGEKRA